MVNPNKYIRQGYITAMAGIGAPVWDKVVPKDTRPIPRLYVLITSQTKNPILRDKDSFDWECTVTLDINLLQEPGYSETELLDDLEEKIITIIESDITIPRFIVKETLFEDSTTLESATSGADTIDRRVVTYSHWLNNIS